MGSQQGLGRWAAREAGVWEWLSKHRMGVLIALVALNIALKIPFLGSSSLFLDEAVAIFETQGSISDTIAFSAKDPTPPQYYLLLGLWCKVFGISEFSARFPSMLFSAMTAAAIFWIGNRFSSTRTGLYAALVFTFSNVVIAFSHESRAYALASMLMVLSYGAFLALVHAQDRHWRPALALGLVNVLLLYTHYLTAMGIAAEAMLALWMLRGRLKAFLHYGVSQAFVVAAWLPWLMMNRSRIKDSKVTSWLEPPDLEKLRLAFTEFAGGDALAVIAAISILVGTMVLIGRFVRRNPPVESGFPTLTYGVWFLGAIGLQVLVSHVYMPVFGVRYALYAVPGACLLLGALWASLPVPGILRNALVLAYLGVALLGLNLNPQKIEQWRDAVAQVRAIQDSKTGMVINAYYQSVPFAYYYNPAYFKDEPGSLPFLLANDHIHCGMDSSIVPVIDDSLITSVILVLSHDQLVDPDGTLIDFMNRHYCLNQVYNFAGIRLMRYTGRPCDQQSGHFRADYETVGDTLAPAAYVEDPSGELGNHVTLVSPTTEFSATFVLEARQVFDGAFRAGEATVRAYALDTSKTITMVIVMEHGTESYNWQGLDLNPVLRIGEWVDCKMPFKLPDVRDPADKIKFYFWSEHGGECLFDDLQVQFW